MVGLTLSAGEIKAAPVEVQRWLERQVRRSFDHGAMPDHSTKDSASPPKTPTSGDIASNDSKTEGNGEMSKKGNCSPLMWCRRVGGENRA
jgi:hypothetical protein